MNISNNRQFPKFKMSTQSLIVQLCVIVVLAHLCFANTKCRHTFRYRGGNDKTPKMLQDQLKKINWAKFEKLMMGEDKDSYQDGCWENVKCLTMTCKDADGNDLFRIAGCQIKDGDGCAQERLNGTCEPPNGFVCEKCDTDSCNNAPELVTVPPTTTTTTTAPPPTVEASTAGAGVVTLTATSNAIIIMLMLMIFGALLFH